jgi:HD-like signal output (HDOD) protein
MTDTYTDIIQTAYSEGRPLSEVEYEELEMTHSEIGALFVRERWQFSEDLAEAILLYEYAPELSPRNPLAEALYVSDRICIAAGLTNGALGDPSRQYPEPMEKLEAMGYSEETQEKLVSAVKEISETLDSYLS